ncbi:tail fiber assembly protein [Chromobacterium violaceum]|uniref:tail fiber assembly protein n=1 Tax=Chromobacterium violaceum TaxID=536 RepID=UPI00143DD7A5|nr:tail fiber assembly protein [Chromobacterium violaceum]QIY78346.1 tail fiber assembly protein [Chromobacterium violaceum]
MQNIDQKTVYSYSPETGEYAGTTSALRSPLDADEIYLVPAWAAESAPPAAGRRQAAAFRTATGDVPRHCIAGSWCVLPDWRGVPLWSTATARPVAAGLGDTPDSLNATELEPPAYGVWDGGRWRVDAAAEAAALTAAAEAEISVRRALADAAIVPLADAESLRMATPDELDQLTQWRRYRVELSRVPKQPGFPRKFSWPIPPEK